MTPDPIRLCEERTRSLKPGSNIIGVLVVVAIGQIIGWGTVGLLAVVGRQVAADLDMDISAVFAGNSIFYVTTGSVRADSRQGIHPVRGAARDDCRQRRRRARLHPVVSRARSGVVFRGMGHPRHGRQRDARHGHLHSAQRDRGPGCKARDRRADAGDGTGQQHLLADDFVSCRSARLARHLSCLCRADDPGLRSLEHLRAAAPRGAEGGCRSGALRGRAPYRPEKHVLPDRAGDGVMWFRDFRNGCDHDRTAESGGIVAGESGRVRLDAWRHPGQRPGSRFSRWRPVGRDHDGADRRSQPLSRGSCF